jgi:hypothetical protein
VLGNWPIAHLAALQNLVAIGAKRTLASLIPEPVSPSAMPDGQISQFYQKRLSSEVKPFARKYTSSDFQKNMICCAPSRLGQEGRTRRHGR